LNGKVEYSKESKEGNQTCVCVGVEVSRYKLDHVELFIYLFNKERESGT